MGSFFYNNNNEINQEKVKEICKDITLPNPNFKTRETLVKSH